MSASSSHGNWSDKSSNGLARQQSAINSILDKLDAADSSKYRNRRQSPRVGYRKLDVPIRIYHPGGTVTHKTVAMRNLSAQGVGFLYTGFIHIGTKVELMLPRRAGGEDLIAGKVVFCGHVSGAFHQIGVRFDYRIAPRNYVDRESLEAVESAGQPATTLGGEVMHIDESEVDRKLLAHYLRATKISLLSLSSVDQALEAIMTKQYDLILCEANFKSMCAETLIARLRTGGFRGRFIILTTETSPERLRAIRQAGATGMLSKPYDQSKLQKLIGPFLKRVAADCGVTSTLAAHPEMAALIERYIASVQQSAADIENATAENQIDRVRQICNSLKGSGASYGFAVLSDSAKEAMRSLDSTMSLQESADQIQKLVELCKRVIVR